MALGHSYYHVTLPFLFSDHPTPPRPIWLKPQGGACESSPCCIRISPLHISPNPNFPPNCCAHRYISYLNITTLSWCSGKNESIHGISDRLFPCFWFACLPHSLPSSSLLHMCSDPGKLISVILSFLPFELMARTLHPCYNILCVT